MYRSMIALVAALLPPSVAHAEPLAADLDSPARVVRDSHGVPHVFARSEHDVFYLQGWVHAHDRLFQMDLARHQASGTLAELLGPAALGSDVELRTLGLMRAAEASLPLLSQPVRGALEAYADGVNDFVAAHPLPVEYGALELTAVTPWTPADSVAVAKAMSFSLSFELDITRTLTLEAYEAAGAAAAFDGHALYFEDLFRSAPFAPTVTLPPGAPRANHREAARKPDGTRSARSSSTGGSQGASGRAGGTGPSGGRRELTTAEAALCRRYLERIHEIELLREAARPSDATTGSNAWVVDGRHTDTGTPLLANDPHLGLTLPAAFHEIHLVGGSLDVIGGSLPGVPFVVAGHNRDIAWGMTTHRADVTDMFKERLVPDPLSPSGLSSLHEGQLEPIVSLPQQFLNNVVGDGSLDNLEQATGSDVPASVLIVPRRQGPLVALDLAAGTGLSVQYVGFGGTRELETFSLLNRARGWKGFQNALRFFDVGSQNFLYADVRGWIGYHAAGAVPLREDLENGRVHGLPPFFVREGSGGNEWLSAPAEHSQTLPYRVLPFEELAHASSPASGVLINANNDPTGTTLDNDPLNQRRPTGGIHYLWPFYNSLRASRIEEMTRARLESGGKLSVADMRAMQADTVLADAQVLVPFLLSAFDAGTLASEATLASLAADARIVEAVQRFAAWDFTTPTGLRGGYDASSGQGSVGSAREQQRVQASIAATLYAVWRSRLLANVIDRPLAPFGLPGPDGEQALSALRHLLDEFDENAGVGASGLDFFAVPGVAGATARRDIVLLRSLSEALDLLASDAFAATFAHSTAQQDYRWGLLHRVVLEHALGAPFSAPPAGGAFPAPLGHLGLSGIPTDGGFHTVDSAIHSLRASTDEDFTFSEGPARRFIAAFEGGQIQAEAALPGGESGAIGSPGSVNLLRGWLANESFPLVTAPDPAGPGGRESQHFVPLD